MESELPSTPRFGAGLPEVEVLRLQAILKEECGTDVTLPEAWAVAIELLTLVEMLLSARGVEAVRASSLLTERRA